MKKILSFILLLLLILSCKKNIEIGNNGIFINGGIKSELVIQKIVNNNPSDTISFPSNFYIKEKVKLKIVGEGISKQYENGVVKFYIDGEPLKMKAFIDLKNKNQFFQWTREKPLDNKTYSTFPMEFEKEHWYSIRNIHFRGSDCYFHFYINKKGEFEYDDVGYIHLSPI